MNWISLRFYNAYLLFTQLYFFDLNRCRLLVRYGRILVILCVKFFSQFLNCISLLLKMHFLSCSQLYFSCFANAFFSQFPNSISLSFSLAFLSVNQLYLLGYWEWMTAAAAASKQRIFVLDTVRIYFSFSTVYQLYFPQFLNYISLVIESGWRQTMRRISGLQCWQEPPPIDQRYNSRTQGRCLHCSSICLWDRAA